jgi:hypothetical protein
VLHIDGICGRNAGEFLIAVGEVAHEKHRFHEVPPNVKTKNHQT